VIDLKWGFIGPIGTTMELSNVAYSQIPNPMKIIFVAL
jgi:hypothetical protein